MIRVEESSCCRSYTYDRKSCRMEGYSVAQKGQYSVRIGGLEVSGRLLRVPFGLKKDLLLWIHDGGLIFAQKKV
jgi:hypothetical protein